jgi:hypothetical protein
LKPAIPVTHGSDMVSVYSYSGGHGIMAAISQINIFLLAFRDGIHSGVHRYVCYRTENSRIAA